MTDQAHSLSDTFNNFAIQSQEDHPELKDGFLVLDIASGETFGRFDLEKYSFFTTEDLNNKLSKMRENGKNIGSHAGKIKASIGSGTIQAGYLIAFAEQPQWERIFNSSDDPKGFARMFTLYHELGHLVVENAFHNYHDENGKNFSESAADVYALIRMRQQFPMVEKNYFAERVKFARAYLMTEVGSATHFSSFAVDALIKRSDTIGLASLTPGDAADLAYNIAKNHVLPEAERFAVKLTGAEFRAQKSTDPEKAFRDLSQKLMKSSDVEFQAGMFYLKPLLDGFAKHPKSQFIGEFWDEMRSKLYGRLGASNKPLPVGQPPFWSPPPIGTFPPDRMAAATGASA